MRLDRDARFQIGLKIGRRGFDLVKLLDLGGIPHPKVPQGSFGAVARAVGVAAIPDSERYMIRQEPKGM